MTLDPSLLEKGVSADPKGRIAMRDEEFRELVQNAPVMLWRADADGMFDWFNEAWLGFVGRPIEAELGFGWSEGVHDDDRDRCLGTIRGAFESRSPFTHHYRVRRNGGDYRWLLDRGAPYEREGRPSGHVGSRVDVTELFEVRAHKDLLLSELNHRVKNNLQLVISFLSFSVGRAESVEAKAVLTSAIRRVQGVGAVQEQLHRSSAETVDLADYLATVARMVVATETERSVRLEFDTVPLASPFPQATSLGLIVNELVSNALKHAPPRGGRILVRLARLGGDKAELVVTDDGPGFTAGALERAGVASPRGGDLVDALARHAKARIERDNSGGARVRLIFPCR